MQLHYYDYGPDKLTYFDEGAPHKTTLLCIHGFGEDHGIWKNQIDFLSQYYRVIAPNLPGVHCKPLAIHHTHEPSISNYVEVMHELMHHLQIEKYYVIGHSMGGYIGLAFANYYVNHIIGLALVHSTTYEDSVAKKESRLKVVEFIQEQGTRKFLETATQNLFGNAFKKAQPQIIQDIIDSASDISPEAMIQFVMAMRNRKSHKNMLLEQRIPIFMIVGEEDIAVPIEDSHEQVKFLSKNHVVLLKHVGHMGMLEAPTEVNNALLSFIQLAENK